MHGRKEEKEERGGRGTGLFSNIDLISSSYGSFHSCLHVTLRSMVFISSGEEKKNVLRGCWNVNLRS